MATHVEGNVDYRLLNNLSRLVICSQCLQKGTVTPVPQVITPERRITNVCANCRTTRLPAGEPRTGKLLPFRRR